MIANVAVGHFGSGVVRQNAESLFDAGDILWRLIDQEIDVFRESACAVRDDGEATDQHVPRASVVQGATDADEVFRLWCSCVRSIIWIIHASASSKLEKR